MENEKVKLSAFLVQGLATISIAFSASLTGFFYAWPSYTIANFQSNETILSHPMSSMEVSMLGSLTNVGALVATPLFGYAVNNLGRKYAAILVGVPYLLAWTIISVTTNVTLVIAALGLAGFGAAGQVLTSVYISEIAQDSIRGALTSTTVSGYLLGLLVSYTLGGHLTYNQVLYTHMTLTVLYMLILTVLKESPVFLLQKGRDEDAARSIAFYRQVKVTSKEVEVELKKTKLQLDPRIDQILQEEKACNATKELIPDILKDEVKTESSWKILMKSESSKRALMTVLILMAASIMMGGIILQVYAEPLFKEAVPSMPSNQCSIFLAVDLLIASLIFGAMVDRFGRKFLMTCTSLATGFCTLLLGAQLHFYFAPPWFTAFLIYAYCFMSNLGASTVPFILPAEVFLPEVRGICTTISMAWMWIFNFLTLIIFNPLVDIFGLGSLFYGFTGISFLTALFSHLCLPETKGLAVDAIQLKFLKKEKRVEKNKVQK